jgi:hypothetical protein
MFKGVKYRKLTNFSQKAEFIGLAARLGETHNGYRRPAAAAHSRPAQGADCQAG